MRIDITNQVVGKDYKGIDLDVVLIDEILSLQEKKEMNRQELFRMISELEKKGEQIEFCKRIKGLLDKEIEKEKNEKSLLLDVINVNSREITVRTIRNKNTFRIKLKEKELAKVLNKKNKQIELSASYCEMKDQDIYLLSI